MNYTLAQISEIIQAKKHGTGDMPISQLLTDSRSLYLPEETLFFALRTDKGNGHQYIDNLRQRGVCAFVVDALPCDFDVSQPIFYLVVDSPLKALQTLATYHRRQFNVPVIGITGSNGKTIVKEWLATLLQPTLHITRSPRSYNSQIGVPLSVWQMNARTEVAIFEAGISQSGEMQRLEPIIRPTIGIFTHLGTSHSENFSSETELIEEKLKLMQHCHTIIYPADELDITHFTKKHNIQAKCIGWTADKQQERDQNNTQTHTVHLLQTIPCDSTHTLLRYRIADKTHECLLPFADQASIHNAMSVICAAQELGLSPETIAERIPQLEPVTMRMEVKEGRQGCLLINDSYNSDLSSLHLALDFLNRRSSQLGLPATLILSDLPGSKELAKNRYEKIIDLISHRNIQSIIAVGPDSIHLNLPNSTRFPSVEALLASGLLSELQNEVILLKGARSFLFERIDEILTLKVHETVLKVNLNALIANLNDYRARLRSNTKIVCMVKASAYGIGAIEVSKTLQEHGVDYLAVAVADEGIALRRAGITTGIMVMNPEISALAPLFEYNLEPEIYSFRLLEAFTEAARRAGAVNFPIHIKVDTGMHRMGFSPTDIPRLTKQLSRQTLLHPRSVFSHLAGSDAATFDDFTRRQIDSFTQAATTLQTGFETPILRHILNTAGIERFADSQFEMVRLGIGLYGVSPVTNKPLHAVSSLHTVILQIRDIPAGHSVGYSRRSTVQRPSRIADIPIGYADGLDRHLSNGRGYALVNGCPAPYIGNICMDIAMLDVTDIPCAEGDTVEIFGSSLPVTQLSEWLDTIPYEILTSISERVKRIYFQET